MTTVAVFDGVDDVATAPDSATLRSPSTALTIAGWVYRHGTGESYGQYLSKLHGGATPWWSYSMFRSSGGQNIESWLGGSFFTSNVEPTLNAWRFLAYTWSSGSGARIRMWEPANDTPLTDFTSGAITATLTYTTGALGLGGHPNGTENHAVRMARWGVHNAVVSDADLKTWRDTGTPPITLSGAFFPLQDDWNDAHQSNNLTATGAVLTDVGTVPWGVSTQDESGGSSAAVTVAAVGSGSALEAGSGGSSAAVTIAAVGGRSAVEAGSGGSSAAVAVAAVGAGTGSTGPSYTPIEADIGKTLQYRERATNAFGTSPWVYSETSLPVEGAS